MCIYCTRFVNSYMHNHRDHISNYFGSRHPYSYTDSQDEAMNLEEICVDMKELKIRPGYLKLWGDNATHVDIK